MWDGTEIRLWPHALLAVIPSGRSAGHGCRGALSCGPDGRLGPIAVALSLAFAAGGLAGCSFSDGVGPFIVDPGRYSAYHCNDLVRRLKELQNREKDLSDLMDKASEGGGGSVIGALSYRPEYERMIGEEKVLRRTAAEKRCELGPPPAQSDQAIR